VHATTPRPQKADTELVDAFIGASRALVAVAARSLAEVGEDVTLPQYRVLVLLGSRGPQRAADLAAALRVNPSTATRMIERLVRKQLVRRTHARDDRRSLRISLSPPGRALVTQVTGRRREEVATILEHMPGEGRTALLLALRSFAAAAGEVPEQDWSLGWGE
jgi:DNA-binding MarR family transcriptional regulator